MSKYISRWGVPLALSLVLVAGACDDDKPSGDALAQDTTLNRDLQMANQDTAVQPALQDVAVGNEPAPVAGAPAGGSSSSAGRTSSAGGTIVRTPPRQTASRPAPARPVPVRPAPARTPATRPATTPTTGTTSSGNTVTRTPAAAERTIGSIPAGSTVNLTSNSRICTNTNRVGQRFNATVRESVDGSNGTQIPAGARATVEITQLERSENATDNVRMGFRVVSVSFGGWTYPIDATTTYANVDKVRNQPKDKDVQKVIGGAAIGAILGQVLGKDTKSTVIGAAGGAAAGTATAAATANYEGCVPSGGRITVTLDSSTEVQA
ncbi:MAG: hypothetical protein H0U13_06245 [Gemmatimonadaceae bacterium]|nr:hypothetical protein [Gemmatimonadaceae bacterium]